MNLYKFGVLLFWIGVVLGIAVIIGSIWWPQYTITTLGGIVVCIATSSMVSGVFVLIMLEG
jgi:hypothetical protein